MATNAIPHPESSEYAPYYHTYIGPVADADILAVLKSQKSTLERLRSVSDPQALHRYAPDKWSVKEVVGHVTDAERVFSYRMLRIARGDQTPLAGFDQQPYVEMAHFDRLALPQLIDAFGAARDSTLALASELDDDAWRRMGVASGFPVSARALAYIIAGHATHHFGILRDKYGMAI